MKRIVFAISIIAMALTGCGTNQGSIPEEEQACIQGKVTEVNHHKQTGNIPEGEKQDIDPEQRVSSDDPGGTSSQNDHIGSIFVEGEKESDKFVISVDDNTEIIGQAEKEIEFTEISEGAKVEVYCVGGIQESYPAQGMAGKIIVTE
ncbi:MULTISPECIES: DUF3221 domain-containing protein [Bacillus]|uniref:DUF3221 domain-containing protein n=2 Tax=Bacillus TaxID=1386 RepID=A0A0M5JEP1_9BACI|nr:MULTISPECIES: DUF3221 domain-containing protein [Bacillus]ALC83119.1 hypothetical protein AM592_17240 [Bacillus gobiensis]MBP1082181.1 hypothetical protein [Bacillus capparidis]MED1096795.1 DUF3221 domain-containing protein [Bacillus capparidis]